MLVSTPYCHIPVAFSLTAIFVAGMPSYFPAMTEFDFRREEFVVQEEKAGLLGSEICCKKSADSSNICM